MSDFDPTCVYLRDASWHPRSRAGGKMPVYHAIDPDDPCMAACSDRIMLLETSEAKLLELRDSELCRKPACRRAFAAMEARKP